MATEASAIWDKPSQRQLDYLDRVRRQKSMLYFSALAGNLRIGPGVAHPKSDTHLLTLAALPLARGRVLDAFCGGGPVGLALVKQCTSCTFLDISRRAIENAQENARGLNVIEVCQFITGTTEDLKDEKPFDLIVANPPYTNAAVADEIDRICFDPGHSSLLSLIDVARHILAPHGRLVVSWPNYSNFEWLETVLSKIAFNPRIAAVLKEPLNLGDTNGAPPAIEYRVYDSYVRLTSR